MLRVIRAIVKKNPMDEEIGHQPLSVKSLSDQRSGKSFDLRRAAGYVLQLPPQEAPLPRSFCKFCRFTFGILVTCTHRQAFYSFVSF